MPQIHNGLETLHAPSDHQTFCAEGKTLFLYNLHIIASDCFIQGPTIRIAFSLQFDKKILRT